MKVLQHTKPHIRPERKDGYSSPAESGIMEDLGLSLAAYSVFGSGNDNRGTDRFISKRENSRSHWLKRSEFFCNLLNITANVIKH
ncbi:hypothetical protein EZV62_006928 [Acer yangbiense]|uniref:Uncharacterized protein n=1 Tax=Acer yangbiense TaxID=1000413 RepID=A0A5C7I7V0_9ROSI|nr:hypothetical protein EZV62_006928 [Acer yangbiense]